MCLNSTAARVDLSISGLAIEVYTVVEREPCSNKISQGHQSQSASWSGFALRRKPLGSRRSALQESTCKPGSVEGNHSSGIAVAASLKRPTRKHARITLRCDLAMPRDFPIWPCSRWGLPCRRCCHRRGALLPHRFTLTGARCRALRRFTFCCTFRGLAPPRRYLAPCPRSPDFPPHFARNAAIARPTPGAGTIDTAQSRARSPAFLRGTRGGSGACGVPRFRRARRRRCAWRR